MSDRPFEVQPGRLRVRVVADSIAALGERYDALVSPDGNYLVHGGGASRALWTAGGPEIEEDAAPLIGQLRLAQAAVTRAGKLNATYLIHAVTLDLDQGRGLGVQEARALFGAVLDEAARLGCRSVATPLLGTGMGRLDVSVFLGAALDVVEERVDFPGPLDLLTFADLHHVAAVREAVSRRLGDRSPTAQLVEAAACRMARPRSQALFDAWATATSGVPGEVDGGLISAFEAALDDLTSRGQASREPLVGRRSTPGERIAQLRALVEAGSTDSAVPRLAAAEAALLARNMLAHRSATTGRAGERHQARGALVRGLRALCEWVLELGGDVSEPKPEPDVLEALGREIEPCAKAESPPLSAKSTAPAPVLNDAAVVSIRRGDKAAPGLELSKQDLEFIQDSLAEAQVFRKHGLLGKAVERLKALLVRFPDHLGAVQELADIDREAAEAGAWRADPRRARLAEERIEERAEASVLDVPQAPAPLATDGSLGSGVSAVLAFSTFLGEVLAVEERQELHDRLQAGGYRGSLESCVLEYCVRCEDPGGVLHEWLTPSRLRRYLEARGLTPAPAADGTALVRAVLEQLGFPVRGRPVGLPTLKLGIQGGRSRVHAANLVELRGLVTQASVRLERALRILLSFVSQAAFKQPAENLAHEQGWLAEGETLERYSLGGLLDLTDRLDRALRKGPVQEAFRSDFRGTELFPAGSTALAAARNSFAHYRAGAEQESLADARARALRFFDATLELLDALERREPRLFPTVIQVTEIRFDRWGRKTVEARTDDGLSERLFTDVLLQPGEVYFMHPLSNPYRVFPILHPAGDLGTDDLRWDEQPPLA